MVNQTQNKILEALGKVQDPDLKKDLVTLGMIQNLDVSDDKVAFTVVLTTPACPLKETIKQDCLDAVSKVVDKTVDIDITMSSNVTSNRLDKTEVLPNVKNIVVIASGKGGVGKSTVTSNLAIALAKSGATVGLLDADIFGPSQPTMFNCIQEKPSMTKEEGKTRLIPITKYGIKIMSIGFLAPEEAAVVWRGPMASQALKQFITEVEWGALDYLLVDLPPGTSDIHLTLAQNVPITGAVIVTTPQKIALTDVKKGISMFKQAQINVPILGLIENMAYFTPKELPDNKYYIFGQSGGINIARQYDIHFLGEIPIVQSIREGSDAGYPSTLNQGVPMDIFMQLSKDLAQQIAILNAKNNHQKTVKTP